MKSICMVTVLMFCFCFGIGILPAEVLRVGMELTYPPFETIDKNGNPLGVSVDIAGQLAAYLGRTLQIVNLPFIGLIPALKTDKVDVIISSITKTTERSRAIAFSKPYLVTGLCLLVSIDSPIDSIELADREGVTIVVKQGTTGETYARHHIKHAKVLVLDKESSCVLEVSQGKADAFIFDQFSILKNWWKNQKTTRALLHPFQRQELAIGVKHSNEELLKKVNLFIESFISKKEIETILRKYLGDEMDYLKQHGIEVIQ